MSQASEPSGTSAEDVVRSRLAAHLRHLADQVELGAPIEECSFGEGETTATVRLSIRWLSLRPGGTAMLVAIARGDYDEQIAKIAMSAAAAVRARGL